MRWFEDRACGKLRELAAFSRTVEPIEADRGALLLRHPAVVPPRVNSSPEGLRLLADEVKKIREVVLEAGSQKAFGRDVGVCERTICSIENAEAVSAKTLGLVGKLLEKHLRDWTIDTPREIAEGAPVPPLVRLDLEAQADARRELAVNQVIVNLEGLAGHPQVRAALVRIKGLRQKDMGLSDTQLLDAIEQLVDDRT